MVYSTLRIDGVVDDERRTAVDELVRRAGGKAFWRIAATAARTYALLELPQACDHAALRIASGGVVYDKPVIAMAVFPALAEALPALLDALGGPGRPAGVLSCTRSAAGAVVEWDPDVTQAGLIAGLIDVELRRFGSARIAELLSPLPPALVASIAAAGLQASQIVPQRILELRIDRA
ncbi:MAG: hypothetical protein JO113_04025 [Candidatus Eremiobacteraeota bacterium]|nr:hypothetical protein [Candidatus Eremiobacteraeota bacterium]